MLLWELMLISGCFRVDLWELVVPGAVYIRVLCSKMARNGCFLSKKVEFFRLLRPLCKLYMCLFNVRMRLYWRYFTLFGAIFGLFPAICSNRIPGGVYLNMDRRGMVLRPHFPQKTALCPQHILRKHDTLRWFYGTIRLKVRWYNGEEEEEEASRS